ncbi:unnamed protein product [Schistocephalus solidus]|uniref:Uncharacterized protein n=1 Tax=Schistocephalus solidus TaxID=70667 RepID=A0A183T9I1_SCHSO|nr:unnamed protein product [Schistocephalus solidus]
MLDLEVVPELALRCRDWELVLGMPLQQAIEIIRKQDSTITNVDFWHSDKYQTSLSQGTTDSAITKLLSFYLRHLREMADSQRPVLRATMKIPGFSSRTFEKLGGLGGIGNHDSKGKALLVSFLFAVPDESVSGNYRLCYRGITFVLSAPSREDGGFATPVSPGSCSLASTSSAVADLSRLDASDINLFVKRIYLFLGQNVSEAKPPSQLPSSCYHGNIFLERLRVLRSGERTKKLAFDLIYQELCVNPNRDPPIQRFSACVAFGDTVQVRWHLFAQRYRRPPISP